MEIILLSIIGAGVFTIIMLLNVISKQLGELIIRKIIKNKKIGE
jgi:hypothetical protein